MAHNKLSHQKRVVTKRTLDYSREYREIREKIKDLKKEFKKYNESRIGEMFRILTDCTYSTTTTFKYFLFFFFFMETRCPACTSTQVYFRKKSNDFQCTKCGEVSQPKDVKK